MKIKRLTILGSSVLLLFSLNTAAQEQLPLDSTPSHRLHEVLIQDNRLQIPYSRLNRDVTVLDSRVINTLPVQSVNELLGYIAGVDIRQRGPFGGQADISLNGGTFDQTLILLNGIKIIDPQTGHNMMNLPISPDAIERIEVLKGPAARAYGINALNGAINIVTKNPEVNGILISAVSGSSFQKDSATGRLYGSLGIAASGSLITKKVRHFFSAATRQSSGHRYNTMMNNNKLFYQSAIRLKKENTLKLMGGYVSNDFGANGFYSPPGDINSREIVNTALGAVNGSFGIQPGWTLRPSISYRYTHDDYIFNRKNPGVYRNNHHTHVVEASLNNAFQTTYGILGVGMEYRSEAIKSNSLGTHQRENLGLYAEYALSALKDISINAGAYVNYSKHFGWQVLPSLDAGYRLSNSWRVYATAGTGTRVPTYTDWYYKGPDNIGNSELTPEHAFHAEGGVKFSNEMLQGSIAYFLTNTTDFIDWVKNEVTDPWQPRNFQKIRTPGLSFQADYQLLSQNAKQYPTLLAGISYTWLNARVVKGEKGDFDFSRYALENLQNQAVVRLNAGFSKRWNATLAARYEQRVNYKDYFLTDARLEGRFWNLKANISVNNLLNVTFVETGAIPLPGRWLSVGVQWGITKKTAA